MGQIDVYESFFVSEKNVRIFLKKQPQKCKYECDSQTTTHKITQNRFVCH